MKVVREEDPMDSGYTVLSNDIMWSDLSCRALGLLVRWLSKPPGVEVDTIPEIVTRAKRRGNKRMEGRDALYTASYELEEEGYLVRRQVPGDRGQYEWVAFVRSRPVPVEERSNPAHRKRDTVQSWAKKARASTQPPAPPQVASSQVTPENGFPGPGRPIPGYPDSDSQGFSYKDSLHSSLSEDATTVDRSPVNGEREAAAPKDTTGCPAAPASSGEAGQTDGPTDLPGPRGGDDQAAVVADSYMTAYMASVGMPPKPKVMQQLYADAEALLAAGRSVAHLVKLAAELPVKGWSDLTQHALKNPDPRQPRAAAGPVKPWCGHCDSPDYRFHVPVDGPTRKCECHPSYVPANA